ncbi:MAG: hypothetical protein KAU23_04390, partial [Anaerolineales bacterium]|nr:hypothetical protein [Anaerolineales bacterium]
YETVISYADEISGYEFPQLINVIFGNISMKPALRLMALDLSEDLLSHFKGPRFGVAGLRELIGEPERPLLFTAIKPIGLSVEQLADMAYKLAMGGLDIIKDDHGIANQPFAPFKERVVRIVEAVAEANAKTGFNTLYAPNVTGPSEIMLERIYFAKEAGVTGLMLLPGYCGLDFVRRVAEDDSINLPLITHPAFMGSFTLSPDFGVDHFVLHGQLMRLAGADISVMPNYIGRFSYSPDDCRRITDGCAVPMGQLKAIFPGPGGGISPESFADMLTVYGKDVAYLVSGNLHRQSPDLTQNAARFREILETL